MIKRLLSVFIALVSTCFVRVRGFAVSRKQIGKLLSRLKGCASLVFVLDIKAKNEVIVPLDVCSKRHPTALHGFKFTWSSQSSPQSELDSNAGPAASGLTACATTFTPDADCL